MFERTIKKGEFKGKKGYGCPCCLWKLDCPITIPPELLDEISFLISSTTYVETYEDEDDFKFWTNEEDSDEDAADQH